MKYLILVLVCACACVADAKGRFRKGHVPPCAVNAKAELPVVDMSKAIPVTAAEFEKIYKR